MAWRPTDWVVEGELDNTTMNWTIGWVRLRDRDEPLQLKLLGNPYPDLAGWKFRIVRPDPIPDWVGEPNYEGIATDQSGTIGDVTADQMLQHYECSSQEFVRRMRAGDRPPTTLRKSLYLEWYSNRNGRVVIQSTRLAVERVGERSFELTEEQWLEQAKQNQDEIHHFMSQLGDALTESDVAEDSDTTEED
ncbi:hypothetical protein LF1_04750 [Rubripirellula obstinata]|uniref:Uncharacterized protein n=1 Tax=Rubripirellula obstinata TaxID=406547 RepID=A0A5B1CF95_9BACT|nr:hypothetical protein [Rubripirellula obstinata]KAA1257984.1 hypothetical protein LF1_04750 [Rubripirellula obstinata]